MGLEGNLRELALQEVLQLLSQTRKSGELHVSSPLTGRMACVTFESGAVVNGDTTGGLGDEQPQFGISEEDNARRVKSVVLDLLTWPEGLFRFIPRAADAPRAVTGVRLNADVLLMEGARRADAWSRMSDRIPNARVVPKFVESDGRAPQLNLQPQEWEVLTGIDGERDLVALSAALGRDVLETAEVVYELLGTGLVQLNDISRTARTRATSPSADVVSESGRVSDLWVPSEAGSELASVYGDDEIFDPILVGVLTPEGLPRLRTPVASNALGAAGSSDTATVIKEEMTAAAVVTAPHRELGDHAARLGHFAEAVLHWNAIVELNPAGADAAHAREAIVLVTRLNALLGGAS